MIQRIESKWRDGLTQTDSGRSVWLPETEALRMSFVPQDWHQFTSLRLRLISKRSTGARIRLEIIGLLSGGMLLNERETELAEVPGYAEFVIDWTDERTLLLVLDQLEPGPAPGRFGAVTGLRLRCVEPGDEAAEIEVGELELAGEEPEGTGDANAG